MLDTLDNTRVDRDVRIVVDQSPAFEFLMTLMVSAHPVDVETLEVGSAWMEAAERRAGQSLIDAVRNFSGHDRYPWIQLLSVAATTPLPRGVDDLIERLRSADPVAVCRRMAGYDDLDRGDAVCRRLIAQTVAGDHAAHAQLSRAGYRSMAILDSVIDRGPEPTVDELLRLLEAWSDRVWPAHAALSTGAIAGDASERRRAVDALSPARAVSAVTGGVEWQQLPASVRSVVLAPSYVGRPWVAHTCVGDLMVIAYPVADATLSPASAAPTRRLARLATAVRSHYRLELTRELLSGDKDLSELSSRLRVPGPTLLRHLLALRAAGLVRVDASTHRYRLNGGPLTDLGQLLNAYATTCDNDAPSASAHGLEH